MKFRVERDVQADGAELVSSALRRRQRSRDDIGKGVDYDGDRGCLSGRDTRRMRDWPRERQEQRQEHKEHARVSQTASPRPSGSYIHRITLVAKPHALLFLSTSTY